jgi:hypothetical protein
VRFSLAILILACAVATAGAADSGKIVKVLPLYLDLKGRDAISPSLFDRDAYQAQLHEQQTNISAIRFDVLWKASAGKNTNVTLRAELRGIATNGFPKQAIVESNVAPHFFRHWTALTLHGEDFKNFGSLVAWKITLLKGDELLAEQKSFLW